MGLALVPEQALLQLREHVAPTTTSELSRFLTGSGHIQEKTWIILIYWSTDIFLNDSQFPQLEKEASYSWTRSALEMRCWVIPIVDFNKVPILKPSKGVTPFKRNVKKSGVGPQSFLSL